MRLRPAVFLRLGVLAALMVAALMAGASLFVLASHRSEMADLEEARLKVLARHLERPVLWDDRWDVTGFLRSTVRRSPFWRYAFVVRDGAPMASTLTGGVPRQLLERPAGERFVFRNRGGSVLTDLAAPIPHTGAVLHMGLDRRAIDRSARPLLLRIALVGLAGLLVGLALAYWAAHRASREIGALTGALSATLDDPGSDAVPALATTGEVADLVEVFNRQMEERRRAVEELDAQRRFLDDIVEALTHPFYVIDAASYTIRLANSAARQRGIASGTRCYEVTHGLTAPCEGGDHPCPLESVRETRKPTVIEHEHVAPDGRRQIVEIRGYPILDQWGNVTQMIEYTIDITQRKQAEEALAESRARYQRLYSMARLMADNLPDLLWAKDLDGRYLFANRALCERLLGARDTEEPIGKTDLFFAQRELAAHPDDPEWFTFGELCPQSDAAVIESRRPGQFEECGFVRGEHVCYDVHKAPLFDDDGRLIGTVGSGRDVTRERRLDEARRRLETAIAQADMGVVILDLDGTVVYANPAYERITGVEGREIVGASIERIFEQYEDPSLFDEMEATLRRGDIWRGRVRKRRPDGTAYTQDLTVAPIVSAEGGATGVVAYLRDVTAEVELEARYLQAQKLESVGRLAGGIAHDFNNLLGAVRAYAELLELRFGGDPQAREEIGEILAATHHGARLTRQLLAFARREPAAPRPLDLNRLVSGFEGMLRQLIGEDITFVTRLAEGLPPVLSDPAQIEQVLANLVVNAQDAMPGGGHLVLETRTEDELEGEGAPPEGGPWVVLAVEDTGVGMTEEVREHIFEPFFTTKEVGKGTGLGLSTCFGIVSQAGGHIRVESEPGWGTTVSVFLPSSREHPLAEEGAPIGPDLPGGSETILLVEDEASLRRAVASGLRDLGYTALEAEDGARALELWDGSQGVDLLLTDEVMPGMAGSELAQRLRQLRPGLPVVLVSGYLESGAGETAAQQDSIIVGKPFSLAEVARMIRDLLDGSAEGETPQ